MTTYADTGVDIAAGDRASAAAYAAARATFTTRQGLTGTAAALAGGYSGLIDMGDYYLVQNDDGVGTKAKIAQATGHYTTLGHDLLAMVVDDAICMGAETISMTNTIDVHTVEHPVVEGLMHGLSEACQAQRVIITGGEIAELGDMVDNFTWNASALGIVAKDRVITGQTVKPQQSIIALGSAMWRSNGFSLVRGILTDLYGSDWHDRPCLDGTHTWGEITLTPSRIFSACLLDMLGRHGQPRPIAIDGLAHITGGGITNLFRILKHTQLGAIIDQPIAPPAPMQELQRLGAVTDREAYTVWNMGLGMLLISDHPDDILAVAQQHAIPAQVIGHTTAAHSTIQLTSAGVESPGQVLTFTHA